MVCWGDYYGHGQSKRWLHLQAEVESLVLGHKLFVHLRANIIQQVNDLLVILFSFRLLRSQSLSQIVERLSEVRNIGQFL